MKTTGVFSQLAALILAIAIATPCWADGGALDLSALAERARARQAAIEADLAALNNRTAPPGMDSATFAAKQAEERNRLEELKARNARVVEGYENHMGSASKSTGPAAPGSSGGIMDKVTGFFKGGSGDSGPTSVAYGASGGMGSGGIMEYLKQNWPGLLGGTVGSLGGYYVGRAVGGTFGGIIGSVALGWLGQKAGEWIAEKIRERSGGSANQAPQVNGGRDPIQVYGGNPFANQTGGTSQAGAQVAPVPQATSLTHAREIMQERYQQFLAGSSTNADPNLTATLYRNYMSAKSQYEQMQYQSQGFTR
ncbi:MAG: hypothetical protein HY815_29895 [Candidatus Riflebacteria bacterium]|nr:hypothetical protein [Candidatus Riflebacteria bacterium]